MLKRERRLIGPVQTRQVQQTPARRQFIFVRVSGLALCPVQQGVAIGLAARGDLGLKVGNGEDGGVGLGLGDEGAGAAAAGHQPPARQFGDGLGHRHARTVIGVGQFVLERNTVAGRQVARQDATLQIGVDALVQGQAPPSPRIRSRA